MEIRYKNNQIRKVCTHANTARKEYGEKMAEKISLRIDQITAADIVEVLVAGRIGRCHPLKGNRQNQYAMDLVQPYRLVFTKQGEQIQIAKVEEIVDYH